jgi:hypothetical protein
LVFVTDAGAGGGYSGTPLAKKLGVRPGYRVLLVYPPPGWSIPDRPANVTVTTSAAQAAQTERAQTERAQTERAQTERAQTERAQTERAQTERAQTEQIRAEQARQARAPAPAAHAARGQPPTARSAAGHALAEHAEHAPGSDGPDITVVFCRSRHQLETDIPGLLTTVKSAAALWIAWPRRAAGHSSDVTENGLRELLLPTGLVDVKVAALGTDWSGLKFVWRRSARP